jgi:beta-lactamase regulating signal transducer with metallopeptidase domain
MITWWMAQLTILGTLLALAARGAESALAVARRPTRWVWLGAMALTVALGAMAPLQRASTRDETESVSLAGATITTHTPAVAPSTFDALLASLRALHVEGAQWLTVQAAHAWHAWHDMMPDTIDRWILVAWVVASVAVLCAVLAVHLRYRRQRVQWPAAELHGTRVRIAPDLGPAVIGVTRAEVVVPQWLLAREVQEQRLVLAHEREHVQQRDPLLLAAAHAAVILLPWHPAVWWMLNRLRVAIELDCDRRVLTRGTSAREYGALLIDLTGQRRTIAALQPAFSCSPSHLERRLIAMTPTPLRFPLLRGVGATALASVLLLAACEAKLPTEDELARMTASDAATAVLGRGAVAGDGVRYFVDGVRVSKADADRVTANQITRIAVIQGASRREGEVRVSTRADMTLAGGADSARRATFIIEEAASDGAVRRDTGDLVYFVDDVRVSKDSALRILPQQIGAVNVRKETGAQNEVRITTLSGMNRVAPGTSPSIAMDGPRASRAFRAMTRDSAGNVHQRNDFTGLLVVDGVITPSAAVNSMSPDRIERVEIIKGQAATQMFTDPRAANGVIMITTKKAKI